MSKGLVCGIDEAGRGPVIGPLVIGCAVFDSKGKRELEKLNVRDSKKVPPQKRVALEPKIKEIAVEWRTARISPAEIDRLRKTMSLNVIEAKKIAELILSLKNTPTKVIVDSADAIEENFRKLITKNLNLEESKIPEIISKHKADEKFIEVSAASILAKVERDREIEKLKEKFGEIGSGYPADELTKKFLKDMKEKGEMHEFIRRSWKTISRARQRKLEEFD